MVPFLLSSKPEKRGGKKTESTTPQVNESNPAKGTEQAVYF